ncbi:MAG TPA: hypothetical protein PKI01_10910 [Bacteroidales bacterium]|nr:hypothetical protein [Bacteroidales bacterium]
MKKILAIMVFMGFFVTCMAQTTQTIERVKLVDAGSAQLVGGEAVIKLANDLAVNDYTVVLTPLGDYKELFVAVKEKNSFVVKSKTNSDAEFQYVVVLKVKIERPNNEDLKKK